MRAARRVGRERAAREERPARRFEVVGWARGGDQARAERDERVARAIDAGERLHVRLDALADLVGGRLRAGRDRDLGQARDLVLAANAAELADHALERGLDVVLAAGRALDVRSAARRAGTRRRRARASAPGCRCACRRRARCARDVAPISATRSLRTSRTSSSIGVGIVGGVIALHEAGRDHRRRLRIEQVVRDRRVAAEHVAPDARREPRRRVRDLAEVDVEQLVRRQRRDELLHARQQRRVVDAGARALAHEPAAVATDEIDADLLHRRDRARAG